MVMETVCYVLTSLENTSKRTEKEAILTQHKENMLLRQVFVAALDPYTNYGVVKFKKPKPAIGYTGIVTQNPFVGASESVEDGLLAQFLSDILPKLASRELSGNAAKQAVVDAFSFMGVELQKWCERILFHKLRTGTQTKTINKIWPKTICPFEVQLASVIEANANEEGFTLLDTVDYPIFVEPKLDGLRMIAVKKDGIVTFFTRNGREIETLPALRQFLTNTDYDNTVLDGEIMGEDWNESASVVMSSKSKKNDSNMIYHVFDVLSFDEWTTQNACGDQSYRRKNLVAMIENELAGGPVRFTSISVVDDENQLLQTYLRYVDEGYEGVMVKDINGKYTFKRSTAWRKLKPFTTYEGVVVDTYDGNVGSKREGKFGGFTVVFPNGVTTNVGSGFSDAEKSEIDNDRNAWIGKIVEVKGQPPLTKDGRVRFPTKERYRDPSDVDHKVLEAFENWQKDN